MKYSVVVADPPWHFKGSIMTGDFRDHYSSLKTDELRSLPVESLVKPDSILALWCPSSMFPDGLWVMQSWGFEFKQIYTWVKMCKDGITPSFGHGYRFHNSTEHALIGVRGKPKTLSQRERNVELSQRLLHSQKSEELQNRLERMYKGPYLELFARRQRDGWTCTGLECPTTKGQEIDSWIEKQLS